MRENILIVGADSIENGNTLWRVLSDTLRYQVIGLSAINPAIEWLRSGRRPFPDIVLLNTACDGNEALAAIRECKKLHPQIPVLYFVAYGNEKLGMEAVKAGAYDFVTKPVTVERLQIAVENALRMCRLKQYASWLERKAAGHTTFEDMISVNPKMREAMATAISAAPSNKAVWLAGEPGTGKTLMARAIHGASERAMKPMIIVNCELLSHESAEKLLFGQETILPGDTSDYVLGKLREADHGSLLLQNPGTLPRELWESLIHSIKTGQFKPHGSVATHTVDVRLICSDSKGSDIQAKNALFLQLLSQAFDIEKIELPSLTERPEDIRHLAEHFVLVYATAENKYITSITDRAMKWLEQCRWQGNVAELANTLWRAVMLCENPVLDITELRTVQRNRSVYLYSQDKDTALVDDNGRVKPLKSVQQEAIRFALQQEGGCMTRAARSLGIGRSTLYRKMQEYALTDMIDKVAKP